MATDARPGDVRRVFGRRRTLPLGVAFGIITVLGPQAAGHVEVATFRRDSPYSDGRHPDSVTFSSAEEDARRRDFTINGLFYDPVSENVIDYVNGQADLQQRVIRAIGDPHERFAEDWLRMRRAARFAAAYELTPDPKTEQAVQAHAGKIAGISPERVLAEIVRLLVDPHRRRGIELLEKWGLLRPILPERDRIAEETTWQSTLSVLAKLQQPDAPTALAALVEHMVADDTAAAFSHRLAKRWKMSNRDRHELAWLLELLPIIDQLADLPWSRLQPIVVHDHFTCLLTITQARWKVQKRDATLLDELAAKRRLPQDELDPPPLLTGDDLIRLGWQPGPEFRAVLSAIRAAQLDGAITTYDEAAALATQSWQGPEPPATA